MKKNSKKNNMTPGQAYQKEVKKKANYLANQIIKRAIIYGADLAPKEKRLVKKSFESFFKDSIMIFSLGAECMIENMIKLINICENENEPAGMLCTEDIKFLLRSVWDFYDFVGDITLYDFCL